MFEATLNKNFNIFITWNFKNVTKWKALGASKSSSNGLCAFKEINKIKKKRNKSYQPTLSWRDYGK